MQKKPAVFLGLLLLCGMGATEINCNPTEREEVMEKIGRSCGNMRPYYVGCVAKMTCIEISDPGRSTVCENLFRADRQVNGAMDRIGCIFPQVGLDGRFRAECGSATVTSYIFGPLWVD